MHLTFDGYDWICLLSAKEDLCYYPYNLPYHRTTASLTSFLPILCLAVVLDAAIFVCIWAEKCCHEAEFN